MDNLNFTAINFETANGNRASVCSVGAVFVRDGEVADTFYSLIRPTPNYYTLTRIHGLTRNDTDSAATFPEVWSKISNRLGNGSLVAHFATFDESCLRQVFAAYNMPYDNYEFRCTCCGAKRYFSTLPASLRPERTTLDVVCDCFNLELNHHNALSDAVACAQIAIKIKDYL